MPNCCRANSEPMNASFTGATEATVSLAPVSERQRTMDRSLPSKKRWQRAGFLQYQTIRYLKGRLQGNQMQTASHLESGDCPYSITRPTLVLSSRHLQPQPPPVLPTPHIP